MQDEKWKIVGGRVYRIAGVFDELVDAVRTAKELKKNHHVFLSRTKTNQWSVYWRSRLSNPECSLKYLSVQ